MAATSTYFRRKKMCYFTANKIKEVDYKDVNLLRKFIMENGKIVPLAYYRHKTAYQRKLAKAVKLARYLALLPYTDRH